MATELSKPISRVTVDPFTTFGPDRNRPFVVSLAPGDIITFRAKGRRNGVVTGRLADVWRMLLIARSNAERMAKLRENKQKKAEARERARLKRGIKS